MTTNDTVAAESPQNTGLQSRPSPSRILIAYSSRPPILDYLSAAFQRRGIEVRVLRADENTWFDKHVIHRLNKLAHSFRVLPKSRRLFENHPLAHLNFRSRRLREAWTGFNPELLLLIRGINFRADVLEQMHPKFGWWVEHEGRVAEALRDIDSFDGYFFMNESCVQAARDRGFQHSDYLAHAVDPSVFCPLKGVFKRYDACFVGNWSEKRQQYVEAALEVTPDIAIYGGKWLRKCWNRPAILKCWKGSYIDGEALNRLYNKSRVVLNVTNWGHGEGRARSGMNMRVLEVPATGSLLLTDESLEMNEFLTPGVHVATYGNLAEFASRLKHLLDAPGESEAIAAAGCAHVRNRHTYDHVAEVILARFNDWVGRRPLDEHTRP
jgi:spore maturation protein CgeB